MCNKLAFYCRRSSVQIDRIIRRWPLFRQEKWESKREGSTYGGITILKAIDQCTATYNPQQYRRAKAGTRLAAMKPDTAERYGYEGVEIDLKRPHGSPLDLDAALADVAPSDLATIIYTSGTTGPPKGVMITHRNIAWTAESLRSILPFKDETVGKSVVSYLPMAHIAERVTSHYSLLSMGYEVTCCPDPGQIADFAREVKPQIMFGVPRVWEKIHSRVTAALSADPEKGAKFQEAVAAAEPIALKMAWDEASDEERATYDFLDQVAFAGVRELLGFDELEIAISGAAPIPPELLSWYRAIGVPMSEIYGMSENCGPMCWEPYRIKPGTVGPAVPGLEVKLADDGEVCCRGGLVFQGYLDAPDKTAEALDADGWLHSGDIGEVDDDGYFRIVDRKKELIITSSGKNISPANLEAALKMIPLVGQAAAIGDQRKFVSALLVLDPETAPIWAAANGKAHLTSAELVADPELIAEIQGGVDAVNEQFANVEQIKKFVLLGEEWLPDSDVLTPTMKLKRRGVSARYGELIEGMYA